MKDATCTSCKKNAFPVDYNKAYACIVNGNLKGKDVKITTQKTNCLKYLADGKCALCANGYYLKNDQSACLSGGCGTNGAAETFESIAITNDGGNPKTYWATLYNHC